MAEPRPSSAGAVIQVATGLVVSFFAVLISTGIVSHITGRDLSWGAVLMYLPSEIVTALAFGAAYSYVLRGRTVENAKPILAASFLLGWAAATVMWILVERIERVPTVNATTLDWLTLGMLVFAGPLFYLAAAVALARKT